MGVVFKNPADRIFIDEVDKYERMADPVGYHRRRRYQVMRFSDGIGVPMWVPYGANIVGLKKPEMSEIVSDTKFPASTLIAYTGKPILEVIDHPVTRERYTAADVIERAYWDDEAQVTVFEVRRAA